MSLKFATIPQKRLLQGITSASTTFFIDNIKSFDGINDVVPADLGTQHFIAFRNDTGTVLELCEIDPATISTGPITLLRRGLSFYGDLTTETTALKLDWPSNSIVMFGSDVPQIFQWLKEYIDNAAIAGAVPASTVAAGIVVEASQAEVDAGTPTKTILGVPYKLFASPEKNRAKKFNDAVLATSGTDAYAIAPSPAITAYAAYQRFSFIADVPNAGACTLNVNGLGAKAIKKNVSSDTDTGDILTGQVVEVLYDGTNMQLLSKTKLSWLTDIYNYTPFFYQRIPVVGMTTSGNLYASAASSDGSVLFLYASTANELYRYARDTNTGTYIQTHNVSSIPGGNPFTSMVVVGNFLYVFSDLDPFTCYRYDLATLANETLMTIPSIDVSGANYDSSCWTDGTFIYVVVEKASTTCYKLAISGTTLTTSSTSTTAAKVDGNLKAFLFDGTSIYQISMADNSDSQIEIKKASDPFFAASVTTTIRFTEESDNYIDGGCVAVPIDTNRMYLGSLIANYNATAVIKRIMALTPFTKP